MIQAIRRFTAVLLCRAAFRVSPDEVISVGNAMGVWPPYPLPTPAQQAMADRFNSEEERAKRHEEWLAYQRDTGRMPPVDRAAS